MILQKLAGVFGINTNAPPQPTGPVWNAIQIWDSIDPQSTVREPFVRFQAFDAKELRRNHPRDLNAAGDISMKISEVVAIAAGKPAEAHKDIPADIAKGALQNIIDRSRRYAEPSALGTHMLADDAARTAFIAQCAAEGITLKDPGVFVPTPAPAKSHAL